VSSVSSEPPSSGSPRAASTRGPRVERDRIDGARVAAAGRRSAGVWCPTMVQRPGARGDVGDAVGCQRDHRQRGASALRPDGPPDRRRGRVAGNPVRHPRVRDAHRGDW
jgi:hypothetical protein